MPSETEKNPRADLSNLLKQLNEAGIEFILVGGLAAVVQGAPISTFDLDIVYRQTEENVKKLIEFLKSVDAFQRRLDDKILRPTEEDLRGKGHLLLATRYGPLDLLAYIENDSSFDDLISNTVEIEFKGHKLFVLSLDFIIQLKQHSKDPKDQYRLPILEETLQQILEKDDE